MYAVLLSCLPSLLGPPKLSPISFFIFAEFWTFYPTPPLCYPSIYKDLKWREKSYRPPVGATVQQRPLPLLHWLQSRHPSDGETVSEMTSTLALHFTTRDTDTPSMGWWAGHSRETPANAPGIRPHLKDHH